jgi:hypothetical protein
MNQLVVIRKATLPALVAAAGKNYGDSAINYSRDFSLVSRNPG